MKFFQKHLEKLGMATTRTPKLAEAMMELHLALCNLDTDNLEIVRNSSILGLLEDYCVIEQVKKLDLRKPPPTKCYHCGGTGKLA